VVSSERYKELEEINETLKKEIVKLERAQSDTERLVTFPSLLFLENFLYASTSILLYNCDFSSWLQEFITIVNFELLRSNFCANAMI